MISSKSKKRIMYKIPRIEEAMVEAVQQIQEQTILLARCLDTEIHNPNTPIEQLTRVIITSNIATVNGPFGGPSSVPQVGTKILIVFQFAENFYQAYYIGQINDMYSEDVVQSKPNTEAGGIGFITESGAGLSIHGNKSQSVIHTQNSNIVLDNDEITASVGKSAKFILSKKLISIRREDDLTGLIMGASSSLLSKGNLNLISSNGEVIIRGNALTFDARGGSIQTNTSTLKEVTQKRIYSDAIFKHTIGTSQAFGSQTAYELSIISGDYSAFIAQGDFDWTALSPTNGFTWGVGPTLTSLSKQQIDANGLMFYTSSIGEIDLSVKASESVEPFSNINASMSSVKLQNGSAPGVYNSQVLLDSGGLSLKQGAGLITSTGSIISLKKGGSIEIKALVKISFDAPIVEIKNGELKVDGDITWLNAATPTRASTHSHTGDLGYAVSPTTPNT